MRFNPQTLFATGAGAVLILLGVMRALYGGLLFGIFPGGILPGMFHMITGAMYLRASMAKLKNVTYKFNKVLGWLFIAIGAIQFLFVLGGNTSLIADMILHLLIGVLSLWIGERKHVEKRKGVSYMKALNFPFGKT